MARGYQYGFSDIHGKEMYDARSRERKTRTMVAVLGDHFGSQLGQLRLLDIGSSTGIIANFLADYVGSVIGIDIDEKGIQFASNSFQKENLRFRVADAMNLDFEDGSFDTVICAQIYEHMPDALRMMQEVHRVLRPNGVCYFAAGNRFDLMEHHYHLPLLSVIPRPLGHVYLRITRKGDYYYEKHMSYWGLKRLVNAFEIIDYTGKIVSDPSSYFADYMIAPKSFKQWAARQVLRYAYWLFPSYIWLLRKTSARL